MNFKKIISDKIYNPVLNKMKTKKDYIKKEEI